MYRIQIIKLSPTQRPTVQPTRYVIPIVEPLDTGAIVGIAVGVTAGLVATAAVGYYTYVHQCLRKSITSV